MTGQGFQQLLTDDDAVALLRTVTHHLNAEGMFAFETRNPAARAWLSWTPRHSGRTIQSSQHGWVSLFYDAQAEPANRIVTIRYHLVDKGVRRVGRNHIRFVNQEHLARLLTKAGLAAVAWHGDWASRDFSPTSNEIIVVTRRATLAAPASNQRETAKP